MSGRSRWEIGAAVVTAAAAVIALLIPLGILEPFGGEDTSNPVSSASSPASGGASDGVPGCYRTFFSKIPADRVGSLEEGAIADPFLGQGKALGQPAGLRLTDGGRPVGAFRFTYLPGGRVFLFELVDTACRPVEDYANQQRQDRPKNKLGENEALRIRFDSATYDLLLQAETNYFKLRFRRAA